MDVLRNPLKSKQRLKISSLFSDLLLSKYKECIYMNANVYVNCRDDPSSGVDTIYKAICNL